MDCSDYTRFMLVEWLNGNVAPGTLPPASAWLGLFSTMIGDDGSGTEAAGGSYGRQPFEIEIPTPYTATLLEDLLFSGMPAGTWTHAGIFDASSGGNLLFHTPLVTPKTSVSGQSLPVAAGDLALTLGGNIAEEGAYGIFTMFLGGETYDDPPTVELRLMLDSTTPVTGGSYADQDLLPLTDVFAPSETTYNNDTITFTDVQTSGEDITWAQVIAQGDPWFEGPLVAPLPDPAGDVVFTGGDFAMTVT